ncbi:MULTISPECIES: ribonuclease G [Enterococcus]|uniref:Ribonuclease G n=1 Tax=Enterococcus alishanensis TaxID=1303817 RepID=A0ABS6TB39_9ENTE|nr:ribonuclease G [Enterococcus alishanensis]MBV7390115.1 ribonuclease G [Enterococcus alishanensis]
MDEISTKIVPREIKGWNWGAFMYNIFWGIGNQTYLPLLCLIPLFNIVWIFVCGFKGNEWAWQKGNYQDVETFLAVQKTWNRAGLVQFIIAIAGVILYFLFFAALISSFFNGYYNY